MRSHKSKSMSPEVKPVSPITISMTTTNVQYQGSVHKMPSLDLGTILNVSNMSNATSTTSTSLSSSQPTSNEYAINMPISPMVQAMQALPPVYSDMYSLTEHKGQKVDVSTPSLTTLSPMITPSTDTPNNNNNNQNNKPSPILSFMSTPLQNNNDFQYPQSITPLEPSSHSRDEDIIKINITPKTKSPVETESEILLFSRGFNNEKCHSIYDCISCKRIIKALEWYGAYQNDKRKLMNKITKYNYGVYLLHDYQHILNFHLSNKSYSNNTDANDIEAQYDKIVNMISSKCDVTSCKGYKRYKSKENSNNSSSSQVIMDTMDAIHCYFLHLDCN